MIPGLFDVDADRLSVCLARLTPHLDSDAVALTGGVAMRLGLSALGLQFPRQGLADLDFVATSLDAVRSTAAASFLVSHYHVAGPGVPKFLVQLVDPESCLRIDIFPDLAGSIATAQITAIGPHRVRVLTLASVFEHKLQTLSGASSAHPIDPMHLHDAQVLGVALGRAVPEVAATSMKLDVYDGEDRGCARCDLSRSAAWPLASKERVFQVIRRSEGQATPCTTKRVLVPVTWPAGKVGRGHLLPDFRGGHRNGFISVPGGRRVSHGMVAFAGKPVAAADMLERWESTIGSVGDREDALDRLEGYVRWVATQKLGSVFEAAYDASGALVPRKVADVPRAPQVRLPK